MVKKRKKERKKEENVFLTTLSNQIKYDNNRIQYILFSSVVDILMGVETLSTH